jgi:hypothetical protein
MSHDKIKAAARQRMAATGESYAAARRAVIREFQAAGSDAPAGGRQRFAISYDEMGRFSLRADTRLGGGPEGGRVEIDDGFLRLRMADFKVDVPRSSVRGAVRSAHQTRGTIGLHAWRGRWLANGSSQGLVEITIDPPCRTERGLSTMLRRMRVNALIVSLVDPDGFVAAVKHWRPGCGARPTRSSSRGWRCPRCARPWPGPRIRGCPARLRRAVPVPAARAGPRRGGGARPAAATSL